MALDTVTEAGSGLWAGVAMDALHLSTSSVSWCMAGIGCVVTLLWTLHTLCCLQTEGPALKYEAVASDETAGSGAVVLGGREE